MAQIKGNGKCAICGEQAPNGLVCKKHWNDVMRYRNTHIFPNRQKIRTRYSNIKRRLVDETNARAKEDCIIELVALAYMENEKYEYSKDKDNLIDMIAEDVYNANHFPIEMPKQKVDQHDGDTRKTWEAAYRCKDGHYVRSKGEMLIDNYLYDNNLLHSYEKKPFLAEDDEIDKKRTSDFYLPKGKIYIEFWGLETEKYKDKRETKVALYKKNQYKLIELEDADIKNIEDILTVKLARNGIKVDE